MRSMILTLLLLPTAALAKPKAKTEPPPPPPPPVAEPAPAPAPEAPAEAAPPPEAPRLKNVSMNVTLTMADGSSKSMAVTGLERADGFHADRGWLSDAGDLKITLEAGKSEKEVTWADIKSISITPGKMPDDVDCSYNSDFNPFMYECSLRTTTVATLKDGSKGTVITRHKWRLSTDEAGSAEFYLYKHTERMQGPETDGDQFEDPGMYTKLQEALRETLKTSLVKSVTIQ
jgi:hypothetical protein